ncbi:MAG: recombinase family protein, partial [Oscillospiraceae bacterium]
MANVRVIPPTLQVHSAATQNSFINRKVAAYARVSTDSDEQLTSYEAQVDYYTNYIKSRDNWELVKVYTDAGISGVSTKNRDGFNAMIKDAMNGNIDLIITKSVSRFARNTVDSLVTVRKLKEKGVEVYFEKENIYTLDSKGELLITIMSSLAQEESRSISQNVTWGHRKRMQDGKVSMSYKQFLGYERGEDGTPQISEEQAKTVRLIYKLFINGKTYSAIAKHLCDNGILSPGGKTKWQPATIRSILTNEKYKGDALLQKRYTVDFLTKKTKINDGEIPQYYVDASHPAIIEPNEFDTVQAEIKRRKSIGRPSSCTSPFSTKIICECCGGYYGSKVWGSNTKYKYTIWRCNDKYKGDSKCKTPHFTEDELKARFVAVFNQLIDVRDELIADIGIAKIALCDNSKMALEIAQLESEMEVAAELSRKIIFENAQMIMNQTEFNAKNDEYLKRYKQAN